MTLESLNRMEEGPAAARLRDCCGSARWIQRMVARRPFRSLEHLLEEADNTWWALEPADWEEAFSHHPRIGERGAQTRVSGVAATWAAGEQRRAGSGAEEQRTALTEGNAEYERRFGRIFIVCATGRSAAELVADLHRRLGNSPEKELQVAAAEQAKITRLRLRKLTGEER
jgi:2-oxo-4-hydroxy-4-carboxy-5-ureidoimidazoline decarboxylase